MLRRLLKVEFMLLGKVILARKTVFVQDPNLDAFVGICFPSTTVISGKRVRKQDAKTVHVQHSASSLDALKRWVWTGSLDVKGSTCSRGGPLANANTPTKIIKQACRLSVTHVRATPLNQTLSVQAAIALLKIIRLYMSLSLNGCNLRKLSVRHLGLLQMILRYRLQL